MYVNVDAKRSVRFIEGWLEHQLADGSWKRFWCVLRDDVIFLFSNQKESKDTNVGRIAVGPGSRLETFPGDERRGYTFRLYTKRSHNNFKTAKAIEREMWKAYVEGISSGDVSNEIDLLPGLIEDVRIKLKQFFMNKPMVKQTSSAATPNLKSGFDSPDNSTSGSYDTSGYLLPHQSRPSISHMSQKYRFHSDPSRTDVPSWFFSPCSRDLSEQILKVGGAYGNTLMRESTSNNQNLVISKRTESSTGHAFTHYIIKPFPQGYKIDVENPHEPKQTLSEVMEFFIDTSGRTTTRPMECNDPKVFGIESNIYNDYNKRIVTTRHDADSGEEIADTEASGPSVLPVDRGPSKINAPPLPHVNKKETKPANIKGPQGGWNVRSASVPNIQVLPVHSDLIQAVKLLHDKSALPPIPQKAPTPSVHVAPPLPPNHPPPLQKAHSQSAMKVTPDILNTNTKKIAPKHTQSVSSADIQVRKTCTRDQQPALTVQDELASVTARIIKQNEQPQEATPKTTPPARSELQMEVFKSPTNDADFKRKLEGIVGNPLGGARPQPQNDTDNPDGYYESISHYQNANVIQNVRK